MHDLGSRQRQQRGANDHSALREAGRARARELGSEQRANGRTDRYADAAHDLRREKQTQGPLLDPGQIDGCITRVRHDYGRQAGA
jgi:hypothetical protein